MRMVLIELTYLTLWGLSAGFSFGQPPKDSIIARYQRGIIATALTPQEDSTIVTGFDVRSCNAGTLNPVIQRKVLERIRYFRELVGLNNTVSLVPVLNNRAQQAALLMTANKALSHTPTPQWQCYTSTGAEAAKSANLSAAKPDRAIFDFILDNGPGNKACGHRRWLLYSNAETFGVGANTGATAVYCTHNFYSKAIAVTYDTLKLICYPPAGFVPAPLVFPRWSVSIPAKFNPDFSNTTVKVNSANGTPIPVKVLKPEPNIGDPTLVWEMIGLFPKGEDGYYFTDTLLDALKNAQVLNQPLTVQLNGIILAGKTRNFSYQLTPIPVD